MNINHLKVFKLSFPFLLSLPLIYIYIFIIQRVKARAIPCPHQPLTRGDNTVSVAQGGTATPCATKQLLLLDRVFKRIIYIYIYTPDQSIAETTLDVQRHF